MKYKLINPIYKNLIRRFSLVRLLISLTIMSNEVRLRSSE